MSFGKVKRTPADDAFSRCLREAHDNTCEWCGKQGAMEASHVFSRRHREIRWDKLNANCLCNWCHRKWHESPLNAFLWFEEVFGEGRIQLLREKMNSRIKVPKKEEREIAAHYRKELKMIQDKRADGVAGYIDFVSWQ